MRWPAAFVQGYVTAHDRRPQRDVLRRLGDGTAGWIAGQGRSARYIPRVVP